MSFFSLARLVRNSFWSTLTIDVIRSRPSALRPHKRLQSLSRQCLSFWGMQYEHEIDEWIQYLVSAMSPFSDANPIFALKWSRVVRTFDSTSPSKSHFAWETTHCGPMAPRFDYFRVFLVGSAAVGTFSFHAPDLCDSRCPAKPWPRYQRLSCLDMVRVTLAWYHRSKTSTVCWQQPHQFFEKILQSVYLSMSSNMFGTWWTFYTATGATMLPSRPVHWSGAFGGGSYQTSEIGIVFAWIHIDLVTVVSLWRHCHLPSA